MITQEIAVHKATPQRPQFAVVPYRQKGTPRFKGELGGSDHRVFIFQRAYNGCLFQEGEILLYKRDPIQIMTILDHVGAKGVEWDGLKPKFIEVWKCDTDEFFMLHPSDIKRPKK